MPESYTAGLDDLQDFKPGTDKPAERRLTCLRPALGLYWQAVKDDEENALKRAKVDGMLDGKPPYDQQKLRAAGQGGRCNLNFGEGQRHLDAAQAGYVDLITSTEYLTDVHTTAEEETILQDEADAIVNEELTHTIRSWADFHPRFLTLTTEYLKHGVGPTYFDDRQNWRFQVTGLRDFKIPRNTRASEEAIDICFARRDYTVHELFEFVSNEKVAEDEGWIVPAVKKAIMHACRTDKTDRATDWEALQQRYKNGDTYSAVQSKAVRLVHTWVKEADSTVSHYIWEERHAQPKKNATKSRTSIEFEGADEDFLYKAEKAHKRSDQAFTIFTYGVGNNGTYHSIRGYGHRIFPQVQYLNRLLCQTADAAAMAGAPMIQPNSMEDLRDLAVQFMGPYNVLNPNVEVVQRGAAPDLTRSMIPVVNDLRGQLEDTSDFYSTARAAQGSPYRNTLQVRAELESSTRLSAANLSLFYASFDRLIREVVRRIVTGPMSDPDIKDFYRRCERRGLTKAQIRSIDHSRTRAARAIGAGNPAARIATLDQLNQERPWMDEVGNRTLTFDRVAARIGHDQAKRYVRKDEQPRGSTEQSLAVMENALMASGTQIPVLPAQLHGTHLEIHLPPVAQLIEAIVGGQADARQLLPVMEASAAQINGHAQALAADPYQQDIVAQALDLSNKLRQILENTERSIQSDGAAGGNPDEAAAQEALQMSEVRQRIMEQEAATRMRIKEAEAQQKQRLRDFEAAAEQRRREMAAQGDALAEPFAGLGG